MIIVDCKSPISQKLIEKKLKGEIEKFDLSFELIITDREDIEFENIIKVEKIINFEELKSSISKKIEDIKEPKKIEAMEKIEKIENCDDLKKRLMEFIDMENMRYLDNLERFLEKN
jgi:hypothetical protein